MIESDTNYWMETIIFSVSHNWGTTKVKEGEALRCKIGPKIAKMYIKYVVYSPFLALSV
jgi:hypothetical protein